MGYYHERLHVPLAWWLLGILCVAILGGELYAGFGELTAVAIYAGLTAVCAAALLSWGAARVDVSEGELAAGTSRLLRGASGGRPPWDVLPLRAAGEVMTLDEKQTRAMRGPRADPAARVLTRPYLKLAVYVAVSDPESQIPYWLIGTRRPAELAEAIEKSRARLT